MNICDEAWERLIKFHSLRTKLQTPEEQESLRQPTKEAIWHIRGCSDCKKRVKEELCPSMFYAHPQKPDPETPFFAMHARLHAFIVLPYVETEHFGGIGSV